MDKSELKYKNWMVTILSNKEGTLPLPEYQELRRVLNEEGDKWVFQEEAHENAEIEKTHYQACLITNIRKRKKTLLKNLSDALNHPIERIRVDKMAGTWDQAVLYCSKTESRTSDTQFSNNMENTYDFSDIAFLDDEEKRYPWQNKILEELFTETPLIIKTPDDRTIYWITDEQGNSGKSKLVKYICTHNDLCVKLSFGTANQLRAATVTMGARKVYILDVPRTLGQDDSMNDILSQIEDLKNGYVVSSFYGNYQKLLMNPPHVVVFSNQRCPVEKLSKDRWKCYIIKDKELKYSIDNEDYVDKGYSMAREGEMDELL